MDLTVWNEKDKLFLKICGEVDHHAVKDTREKVDSLILKNHPKTLIMDLSQIDFMDSSGLGFVLGRLRKMNDIKGEMLVLDPARRVEDMLKMAGADKLLKIVRTKDKIS
ncbi:MAG: anti-sigma factor antagonist [Clostridia bacterium]|nr:anti-sigma factor antagonist [Clostridia bacterium]